MTTPDPDPPDGDAIRRAASAALADVNALGVDGEDRKIILKALLDARLLNSSAGTALSGRASSNQAQSVTDLPAVENPIAGDGIGRLSSALKLDRDVLDLVYAFEGDEPHVVISAKKIAANKALATRQLGQLVAAARQLCGLEEWTSAGTIRKVVSDYGRLDSGNFASNLQQMDSVAVIRGKGQQREVKITRPGIETTADLIKNLAGTDT